MQKSCPLSRAEPPCCSPYESYRWEAQCQISAMRVEYSHCYTVENNPGQTELTRTIPSTENASGWKSGNVPNHRAIVLPKQSSRPDKMNPPAFWARADKGVDGDRTSLKDRPYDVPDELPSHALRHAGGGARRQTCGPSRETRPTRTARFPLHPWTGIARDHRQPRSPAAPADPGSSQRRIPPRHLGRGVRPDRRG